MQSYRSIFAAFLLALLFATHIMVGRCRHWDLCILLTLDRHKARQVACQPCRLLRQARRRQQARATHPVTDPVAPVAQVMPEALDLRVTVPRALVRSHRVQLAYIDADTRKTHPLPASSWQV